VVAVSVAVVSVPVAVMAAPAAVVAVSTAAAEFAAVGYGNLHWRLGLSCVKAPG